MSRIPRPYSPDSLHLHRQLYVHYGLPLFDLLGNSSGDKITKEKKVKLEAQLEEVAKRTGSLKPCRSVHLVHRVISRRHTADLVC
jgi:hypothetical protein